MSNQPENDKKSSDSSISLNKESYDPGTGKSPLEWLEITEGVKYSQLEKISGERNFFNKLIENPVIAFGLFGSFVAICGGLYSIRSQNSLLSNKFLRLRVVTSGMVMVYVFNKIWDQVDWNPPPVQKLRNYVNYAFSKDTSLLTEEELAKAATGNK